MKAKTPTKELRRRFQDVVEQIQESIVNGHLKTGECLPPERVLNETFHISRNTLREALRVLEDRGLIRIKSGNRGGSIVTKITPSHAIESIALLIRSKMVSLKYLAEFRRDVEGMVASLAAQRATDDDVNRLKGLLKELLDLIKSNKITKETYFDIDRKFHVALATICRNPVYLIILRSIHENVYKYYEDYITYNKSKIQESVRFLEWMIKAIEDRNFDEARILAESHVLNLIRQEARVRSERQ